MLAAVLLLCWLHPFLLLGDGSLPSALGAAAGAYVLLRSRELALVAAATVFGAVVLAHGIVTTLGLGVQGVLGAIADFSGQGPEDAAYAIFLDGLAGIAIVLWTLQGAAAAIAQGADSATAADTARARSLLLGRPLLLVVTIYLLLPLYYQFRFLGFAPLSFIEISAIAAIVGAATVAFFCFVVLPLIIDGARFDERMIARANRAQEDIERLTMPLEFLAAPRWALSVSGSAMVVAALVFFDRVRVPDGLTGFAVLESWNFQAVTFYGTVLAVLVIAWRWLRGWRGAVACTVAAVFAATLGAWLSLHAGLVPGLDAPLRDGIRVWDLVTAGTAIIAGQMLVLAAGIGGVTTIPRAGSVLCIGLAWLISCAATPGVLLPIAGTAAALVLLPCFQVALDTLLPRYRSVEEVFGRK